MPLIQKLLRLIQKITEIKNKILDITNLATNADLNMKVTEIESKIRFVAITD